MNMIKRFQLLNIVVLAVFSVAGLAAADRSEFKKLDQPFVVFKAIKGAKFPYMIKYQPAVNELDVVLCGALDENGAPKFTKSAQDLETLIPLRNTMQYPDNGTQVDKKYVGFRDAYMAVALEHVLYALELMPENGYTDIVLVDEYKAGLPMKFVLSSAEYVSALRTYLENGFVVAGVTPTAQKPVLVLEVLDTSVPVSADDQAFLAQYFDILDVQDPEAKAFFEGAQKALYDVMDKVKDAKFVAETTGEQTLRLIEGVAKDLDMKKILMALLLSGVAYKFVVDPIWNKLDGYLPHCSCKGKDGKDIAVVDTKKIMMIIGGAVAAGLVYNLINTKIERSKKAARKDVGDDVVADELLRTPEALAQEAVQA